MNIILCILIFVLWYTMIYMKIKNYLHIIQLEGYNNDKFNNWICINKHKIYKKSDIYFIVISAILVILYFVFFNIEKIKILFFMCMSFLYLIESIMLIYKKHTPKKPFVYTKRAKRLTIITLSLIIADFLITALLTIFFAGSIINYFPVCVGLMSVFYFFSIYYVLLGNTIAAPMENRINKKFYDMAYKKIRTLNKVKTIGITGSYGKTSTKFITAAILSKKFKVINTPESYNTPMGISKIINDELNDNYEIFIAELGATKVGDIEEVACLVNPKIGVLTSVGPCHLKTFGSIKNVADTKYELIECLPDDGIAIFNYDNPYVKSLADKTVKTKILYAIDNIGDADVYAKDIAVDEKGCAFTLHVKNMGSIECKTLLLGKHNILNILAGVSVAVVLKMNLEEIKFGIGKISPVKHRLELLDPRTGILVIDDAFNSNPDGADAALEVLNEYRDKRKIIITPGMIELGEIEKKENEKFGEKISEICDIVILVGKERTDPIYKGLIKNGFNTDNIYVVNSTDESTEILKSIAKRGDIVLYENDLPDTYDEN